MPFGDGTGPAGMGPMTGKAAGYCAGYPVAGYMNPYGGRSRQNGGFKVGFAEGRGSGRGCKHRFFAIDMPGRLRSNANPSEQTNPFISGFTPEQEMEQLKDQSELLKQQLDDMQTRIDELSKQKVEQEVK